LYILGYLLKLTAEIWRFDFFNVRNLANLDQFSHEESFVLVEIHIFQVEFLLKLASKKNTRLETTVQFWLVHITNPTSLAMVQACNEQPVI
jgi:hypothetical protein